MMSLLRQAAPRSAAMLIALVVCGTSAVAATRYVPPNTPVPTPPPPPPAVTVVVTTVTAPYVAPAVQCGAGGNTSVSRC